MTVLQLIYSTGIGIEGTDPNQENLLSRALQTLLQKGKPIKWFSLVLLEAHDTLVEPRWLGVFVHSSGDRIIFFPSFFDQYSLYIGQSLQKVKKFRIDHISLEENWKSWHITSPNSKRHQGGFKPLSLGEGRILWFGLSFKNINVLPVLYQNTEIVVTIPENDSDRRLEIFKAAQDGIPTHILKLPKKMDRNVSPQFIHLSMIIGPKNFPLYRGTNLDSSTYIGKNLALPKNSPFLEGDLPEEISQQPLMLNRVSIGNEYDLQTIAMYLPGSLTVPMTVTASSKSS